MEIVQIRGGRVGRPKGTPKTGGRQKGTANLITREVRATLKDLAEINAERLQGWLDRVAEDDPADALRLYMALLRFVTPTLQSVAIADVTPPRNERERQDRERKKSCQMSDEELLEIINSAPPRTAVIAPPGPRLLTAPTLTLDPARDPLLR